LLQILSGFMIISPPNICDGCFHLTRCVDAKIRAYTKNCVKEQHLPPEQVVWFKSNPKLKATEELLDTLLAEETNKVIIWAHFTKELNTVEDLLQKKGWDYIRVDGRNSNQAQDLSKEFNTNPEKRVWLGQIQTGVALTLTSAAYMVYYGLNYSLDSYLQSMDRNFRIGQDKPVFVYRMTCAGSILEYVIAALSQKIDIANTLTDRINCIFCDCSLACIVDGSTPFQRNCKYKDKTARIITRPKKI
jgi:SNF2 family DNA or RNA helicase